jgi:uncharacterized protein DUF6328
MPGTGEPRQWPEAEELPLSKAAEYLLDECRMVLPGIQALFGFQLIAVFSSGFDQKLSPGHQRLHLLAIALVAVAVAIVMAPAAYHRQRPQAVTAGFVRVSSRLLLGSMLPLAAGICLDFYLIAAAIVGDPASLFLTAGLFATFVALWFVLPRWWASRRPARRPGLKEP